MHSEILALVVPSVPVTQVVDIVDLAVAGWQKALENNGSFGAGSTVTGAPFFPCLH
jgi:hypothetical protein